MPTATGDSTGTREAPQMTGEQRMEWNQNLQIFLEHALTHEVNQE